MLTTQRRLLTGGILAVVLVAWTFVAVWTPNGFRDLLRFVGPAMLLSVAVAWLFFTFAGKLFSWPRAITSVVTGGAVLTPLLAYLLATTNDPDLIGKFVFMVAVGWAASLGGILWSLGGAIADALIEWKMGRQPTRNHYVPA